MSRLISEICFHDGTRRLLYNQSKSCFRGLSHKALNCSASSESVLVFNTPAEARTSELNCNNSLLIRRSEVALPLCSYSILICFSDENWNFSAEAFCFPLLMGRLSRSVWFLWTRQDFITEPAVSVSTWTPVGTHWLILGRREDEWID